MISNQILQNTIDGMNAITHVEFCVTDVEGRVVVSTMKEKKNFEKAVQEFVHSAADGQEQKNLHDALPIWSRKTATFSRSMTSSSWNTC